MLENNKFNGVHYSRYIASWINARGEMFDDGFKDWLKGLGMSEDMIIDVYEMATMGKMELEISARLYMKQHNYY